MYPFVGFRSHVWWWGSSSAAGWRFCYCGDDRFVVVFAQTLTLYPAGRSRSLNLALFRLVHAGWGWGGGGGKATCLLYVAWCRGVSRHSHTTVPSLSIPHLTPLKRIMMVGVAATIQNRPLITCLGRFTSLLSNHQRLGGDWVAIPGLSIWPRRSGAGCPTGSFHYF
jgi:hypothetical protein